MIKLIKSYFSIEQRLLRKIDSLAMQARCNGYHILSAELYDVATKFDEDLEKVCGE